MSPSLRLHALAGRWSGLLSVSINPSYRITLQLLIGDRKVVRINAGDHDAVYRASSAVRFTWQTAGSEPVPVLLLLTTVATWRVRELFTIARLQ